ncbi:MAG: hypothetical protein J7K53_01795 [Bacteroidales bacterium]|nr:hypothetical protein [Bacteroidales bacterium]
MTNIKQITSDKYQIPNGSLLTIHSFGHCHGGTPDGGNWNFDIVCLTEDSLGDICFLMLGICLPAL